MNLKKNIIIYIILFFLIYKTCFVSEKMANVSQTANLIEEAVKKVYNADVEAIRNLSSLANDLTKDGKLVIKGGLEIDGPLTVKQKLIVDKDCVITGDIKTKSLTASDNITASSSLVIGSHNLKSSGPNLIFSKNGSNKYVVFHTADFSSLRLTNNGSDHWIYS